MAVEAPKSFPVLVSAGPVHAGAVNELAARSDELTGSFSPTDRGGGSRPRLRHGSAARRVHRRDGATPPPRTRRASYGHGSYASRGTSARRLVRSRRRHSGAGM